MQRQTIPSLKIGQRSVEDSKCYDYGLPNHQNEYTSIRISVCPHFNVFIANFS